MKSFRDPGYDAIDSAVTALVGIPEGLLSAIRLKGERSNADQVSSAGAKSVYQVTPTTRDLVLKKYGVDAYLGPKQAATAAGYLLKEGLQRNGNDPAAAVGEYIGGTDRKNWGPQTKAYIKRVVPTASPDRVAGSMPDGSQSTFDRISGTLKPKSTEPSLASVYDAYRLGKMDPQAASEFEADVRAGKVMLPGGAALPEKKTPTALPAGVVAAFNSGEMPDEDRSQLQADLKAGLVALPGGASLTGPPEMNMGRSVGLAARNIFRGVNQVAGLVGDPINAAMSAITGQPYQSTAGAGDAVADAIGLPNNVTPTEKIIGAMGSGAVGALVPAVGAEQLAARGLGSVVSEALATQPVAQAVAGATGGGSGEAAAQNGAGPVGQVAASLLGAGTGLGAAAAIERLASTLTGTRAAQAAARITTGVADNVTDVADRVAAKFPRKAMVDDAGHLTPDGQEVALRAGADPDRVSAAFTREPGPRPPSRGAPEPQPTPETPATPAAAVPVADVLPRFAEAQSEGVPLTRGQAQQLFGAQNEENNLLARDGAEGDQARAFKETQQTAIKDALDRFKTGIGDTAGDPVARGEAVKQAISDLRDQGAEGVTQLYKQAEAMGGAGVNLDVDAIKAASQDALIDEGASELVKRSVGQELSRYGLIGDAAPMNEAGITKITLDDGSAVSIRGPVKPLTLATADDFRKAMNRLFRDDTTNVTGPIKSAIDDAVEAAMERAATETTGDVGAAYKAARAAHRAQVQTYRAKDIVSDVIAEKPGTNTPTVQADKIIDRIFGSDPDAVTNLRKIKARLLSSKTEENKAAWAGIKAQGVSDIFGKAVNVQTGNISGARLNTAIQKFGVPKLKVLLEEDEFNQLMKLKRIIGDATIPMSGTTNPSGTFYKIAAFLGGPVGNRFLPGIGSSVAALAQKAREMASTQRALKGITEFNGRAEALEKADTAARDFVAEFINSGQSGKLLPPSLNAGTPHDNRH